MREETIERFWEKVKKTQYHWLWMASMTKVAKSKQCRPGTAVQYYGQFWDGSKKRYAHQVAWEIMYGSIPSGNKLENRCGNNRCIRPEKGHWELVKINKYSLTERR